MNKVLLMILDGWGIGKHDKTDAIFNTPTPFMNSLSEKYPHAQLLTCGEMSVCRMARWVILKSAI